MTRRMNIYLTMDEQYAIYYISTYLLVHRTTIIII